eukprot:scaffold83263_cov19-Tisochrysis_lutea.AAC.3
MWPPAPLPKPPPPPKAPNVPHGEWPWRPCAKGSEWCCKPSVKVDRPCTRAASQHTAAMPHRHCVHDRGLALQGAAAMEGLTAAVVLAGLREAHSSANKRCAGHAVPRQVPSTVFRTLSILSTLGTGPTGLKWEAYLAAGACKCGSKDMDAAVQRLPPTSSSAGLCSHRLGRSPGPPSC